MKRVNKNYSVQYKNGYYILRKHGKNEKGEIVNRGDKTYPNIEDMILYCGFKMDFEFTDAALASKAEYEAQWNKAHLAQKAARIKNNEK